MHGSVLTAPDDNTGRDQPDIQTNPNSKSIEQSPKFMSFFSILEILRAPLDAPSQPIRPPKPTETPTLHHALWASLDLSNFRSLHSQYARTPVPSHYSMHSQVESSNGPGPSTVTVHAPRNSAEGEGRTHQYSPNSRLPSWSVLALIQVAQNVPAFEVSHSIAGARRAPHPMLAAAPRAAELTVGNGDGLPGTPGRPAHR